MRRLYAQSLFYLLKKKKPKSPVCEEGNKLPTLKSLRIIVTFNANVGKGAVNASVLDPGPLFIYFF